MRVRFLAIALLASMQCVASEDTRKVEKATDLSSPMDSFRTFRNAHAAGEWEEVFVCLSPDSRKIMLFGMMAWGPEEKVASQSFAKVFERHRVDRIRLLVRFRERRRKAEDNTEALDELMAAIPQPGGLFAALMRWYIENEPDSEFAEFGRAKWGDLKNVKTEERVATGEYTPSARVKGREPRLSQLRFVRIEGRWHLDFHASKKSAP